MFGVLFAGSQPHVSARAEVQQLLQDVTTRWKPRGAGIQTTAVNKIHILEFVIHNFEKMITLKKCNGAK